MRSSMTLKITNADQKKYNEMMNLRQQLKNHYSVEGIPDSQLAQLFQFLRDHSYACALRKDYDEAKESMNLSNKVKLDFQARTPRLNTSRQQNSDVFTGFEEKWNERFEIFNQEQMSDLKKLKARQLQDKENFDQIWNDRMPSKYRKPSVKLLQLKQIEKSLAVSGNFDQAKIIHQEVDKLTSVEFNNAQNNLLNDYIQATKQLNDKFQNQLDQFEAERKTQRTILESEYQIEKNKLDRRSNVITNKPIESQTVNTIHPAGVMFSTGKKDNGDLLLPPLRPPSVVLAEDQNKKREIMKSQYEYQKRYENLTLSKHQLNQSSTPGMSVKDPMVTTH